MCGLFAAVEGSSYAAHTALRSSGRIPDPDIPIEIEKTRAETGHTELREGNAEKSGVLDQTGRDSQKPSPKQGGGGIEQDKENKVAKEGNRPGALGEEGSSRQAGTGGE